MTTSSPIAIAITACGGQTATAMELGVTQGLIWQWLHGRRKIAAHHCLKLASLTGGAVTVHDLRPDVFGESPSVAAQPRAEVA
jgi:DNA-binding transcriptional regulator YdaS (Cro superfamily)